MVNVYIPITDLQTCDMTVIRFLSKTFCFPTFADFYVSAIEVMYLYINLNGGLGGTCLLPGFQNTMLIIQILRNVFSAV